MIGAASNFALPLLAAAAIVILFIGAAAALVARNAMKRLMGVIIAGLGAIALLAALGAPNGAVMAAVAALAAQLLIGSAIVVRLQEEYGSMDVADIDAADASSEPEDRAA